jgi:hypothetical protein
MAAAIGLGVAFIFLGEGIDAVKQSLTTPAPVSTSTKAIDVEIGVGSSFNKDMDTRFLGPIPEFTFYEFDGTNLGTNPTCQDPAGCNLSFDEKGRTAFRFLSTSSHPEYMKLTVGAIPDIPDIDVCISYMLVTDAVDNHATDLLYVWNGSIGKECGLPWYESQTFIPSPSQDVQPPCIWFSAAGDGVLPMGMSFRLRDMSDPDRDKALGLAVQYQDFNDTLCKAPARMQFWKDTTTDACIPRYSSFPEKSPNGSDINFTESQYGFVLDNNCNPGTPFNNADILFNPLPVVGQGGFGGVESYIPNPTNQIGQGAFGGVQGFVPIPTSTTTSDIGPSQTTEADPTVTDDPTSGDDGCDDEPDCGDQTTQADPSSTDDGQPNQADPSPTDDGQPNQADPSPTDDGQPTQASADDGTMTTATPPPRDTPHGGIGVSLVSIKQTKTKESQPTPAASPPRIKGRQAASKVDKCVNQLTVSEHVSHKNSARSLCESASSWGPDFVSLVGKQFCDMCTRRVWDLCDEDKSDECFHMDTRSLRSKNLKRGEVKMYTMVDEWKRK